jgi:hypothetical protein
MAEDFTLPSRPLARRVAELEQRAGVRDVLQKDPPLILQQHFNHELDLDRELASRYSAMPLMSVIAFRAAIGKAKRGIAMLSTQDGAAGLRIEVDSGIMTWTFTLSSMLGLSFSPPKLSDLDRSAWRNAMMGDQNEIAFLWGQARYEADYVICAPRTHFTNVYAFSANSEAAARLTADVTGKLVAWVGKLWG